MASLLSVNSSNFRVNARSRSRSRNVMSTCQQLALEGFRFQLAAKVRRAFYDGLAAEKDSQARKQQVESAKAFVESAKKRAEAGYASDFETVKSQADLISANKALRQAEAAA